MSSSVTISYQSVDPMFLANLPVPNVALQIPRLASGVIVPVVPQLSPFTVVLTQTSADVKLVVAWMGKFKQPFCHLDLSVFGDGLRFRADPDSSEPPRRAASCA